MSITPFVNDATATVPPFPSDLFLRIVGLRDKNHTERLGWIGQWAPVDDHHDYAGDDGRVLSQSAKSFDAIMIHGEDIPRLARIVRSWREILPNKAIIGLTSRVDPKGTASLLQAGADTLFSLETAPAEAVAFMAALWRRMNLARGGHHDDHIRPDPAAYRLTPTEETIMKALSERPGEVVGYAKILRKLGKPISVESVRSLQVLVSRIRKKCPDLSIQMGARDGYALHAGLSQ